MIALTADDYLSPEDYLAQERYRPIKHEYIDGEIYAMAGTTKIHNIISLNLAILLRSGLKNSGCQTFMADVKVNIAHGRCYFYPDLAITCDDLDDLNAYDIKFPKVIIEVLSASTESFDRGKKFQFYRTIPSLQEYVLVSSEDYLVEIFRRTEQDLWLLQTYAGMGAIAQLASLELPLADIYATLAFATRQDANAQ